MVSAARWWMWRRARKLPRPAGLASCCLTAPRCLTAIWARTTAEVFTEDGFFRTGDLVDLCAGNGTADGAKDSAVPPNFYRIAGRCKDIINRGGMKISPMEIDILLEGLPNSAEAAVCAYQPMSGWGKRSAPVWLVLLRPRRPALELIAEHLSGRGIAKCKLPERLELFAALAAQPAGQGAAVSACRTQVEPTN